MKFYVIALICILTFRINAQVNTQDSLALVDLYNSTNGNGWAFNVNWLSKEPVYKWWGITVDPFTGSRVIKVDLHDNMLTGSIPASIGNLTELVVLGLPNNNLSGTIPESIGNLKNLQTLKLWYNQITGPLPSSIGNLKNLVYLLLNNNKINGPIPVTIGDMTSLQDLELFSNQLTDSIPSSIGKLPNLVWIKLYSNRLVGQIPQSIGNLIRLMYIDLSNNELSGSIPTSLAQPPILDYFNVSNNKLTGPLPVTIMKHATIGQINMSYNQLSGTIPTEIVNAQNLVTLDLSNNQLSGAIPSTIGNLYHLHILNLSNNFLSGAIPASLGNIVQMYYLNLSNNQLTDSLPASFGNLTGIRYLSIANNQLSGKIPTTIGLYTRGQIDSMFLHIESNRYTFKAIETWAAMFKNYVGDFSYAPQATVPIFLQDTIAFVSVGGTGSNNSYKWYNDASLVSSKVSDSSYKFSFFGKYSAEITNSIATKLTLRTDTFYYNGLPAPQITYTGSTSLCSGDSIILYVNANPEVTYRWYKDFALISDANSSSYKVKTSGNYFVALSSPAGSTTSNSIDIKVSAAIPTPIITGNSSMFFCAGQSVTLTSSAATDNQWYRDGTPLSGATSQDLIANASGAYAVKVISDGCESSASNELVVTVNPIPPTPVIAAGNATTFCNGGSVTFTSNASSGNQWYKDGVIVNAATNMTYSATVNGSYAVKVFLNGCESSMSNVIVVTVNSTPPTPTITANGAITFCTGGNVTLTSNTASGNQWYKDGVAIGGATTAMYNATNSGTYTVKTTLNGCQSPVSNSLSITVNPIPSTPAITQNGNILTSSAATGNQWFLNGVVITGATSQTYTPAASGNYTVQVMQNNCTSAVSSPFNFTVTGIPNITVFNNEIKLFPNPVKDKLIITKSSSIESIVIRLIDINGVQLQTRKITTNRTEIDMRRYASGSYIVLIEDKSKMLKAKSVIVKL